MFKIVGIEKLDFIAKDGNKVKGTRLHCITQKNNVNGNAVDTVFVGDDVNIDGVTIGSSVEFSTAFRSRRISAVTVLK